MNIINKVELVLEGFDKCSASCDADCALGILYDYSCALQAFIMQKMKDAQPPAPVPAPVPEPVVQA